MAMSESEPVWGYVGESSEIVTKGRILVELNGFEIGVFAGPGAFYAYENRCPHQGGPVCRGTVIERLVDDTEGVRSEYLAGTQDIACPWHGWEYEMSSGRHIGSADVRLRSFPVAVRGASVFVGVD